MTEIQNLLLITKGWIFRFIHIHIFFSCSAVRIKNANGSTIIEFVEIHLICLLKSIYNFGKYSSHFS
jgi:hypothetical protein